MKIEQYKDNRSTVFKWDILQKLLKVFEIMKQAVTKCF